MSNFLDNLTDRKSLFKKSKGASQEVPSTLANLSMRGNKIRKYSVVRRASLLPLHKRELVIPNYLTEENKEHTLTQVAYAKAQLFEDMKFKNNDEALHIAQFLIAGVIARKKADRVAKKIAKAYSINVWDYRRVIDDKKEKEEKLNSNEKLFMQNSNFHIPSMAIASKENINKKLIDMLFDNTPMYEVYLHLLNSAGVSNNYGSARTENVREHIKAHLHKYYPVGINLPDATLENDINYIEDCLTTMWGMIREGKRYLEGARFFNWKYDYELHKYTSTKAGKESMRRKVNILRKRLLEPYKYTYHSNRYNQVARMMEAYSDYISNKDDSKETEMYSETLMELPSEQYLQELANADKLAKEYDETLSLPDNVSSELADDIMESADKHAIRGLIDYYSNPSGVHGVADVKKFVPNGKVPKAIRQLSKMNSDRGIVPKNMYRMTTDRKVFSNRKVIAGASMMIDCSGSMGWTSDDIREVVEILPASNIAGYVGYGFKEEGYDGMIRVIAKDGRIDTKAISDLQEYGLNSIDYEGLKWLAEQPEPRIWISDQQVVGVDESGNSANLNKQGREEILRFMLKNNIIPIRIKEHVKDLAKQLSLKS